MSTSFFIFSGTSFYLFPQLLRHRFYSKKAPYGTVLLTGLFPGQLLK